MMYVEIKRIRQVVFPKSAGPSVCHGGSPYRAFGCFVLLSLLSAIAEVTPASARDDDLGSAAIVGLGGAYAGVPGDPATIWLNPAFGVLAPATVRAALATRNLYQLSALQERIGSLALRLRNGAVVGGGLSQFGQAGLYVESKALLTAALGLRRNLALGVGLHYNHVEFGDNVQAYAGSSLALAVASRPSRGIVAGVVVRRIYLDHIYEMGDSPAEFETSVAWEGPDITLAGVWSKSPGETSRIGIGQSLRVAGDLPLGAGLLFLSGLRFSPVRYSLGARILARGGSLDYVYESHPELGGTHVLGVSFRFGTK